MRYVLIAALACLALSVGYAADTTSTASAPSSDASATVIAKLDQILANQEKLFQRLDAVDEQLNIIKIRASRKH